MSYLNLHESGLELVLQPHHDVLYDIRRGEIASVASAAGSNRPASPTRIHANLQLTRRCNLACVYCRTASSPKVDTSGELSTEQWVGIFNDLKKDGVRSVFATGGEIFARPDIWLLLGELERRFLVHILINGSALSGELTDEQRVLVSRLTSVQVSLDSATPEQHDRFRGRGSWVRAVRALETVQALGVEAVISAVVVPGKETTVRPLMELADHLGVALLLRPLLPQGRGVRLGCDMVDVAETYRGLGRQPYVRGFLAYTEELYRFDITHQEVPSLGVISVKWTGEQSACLDA
ncbi:MAG: radical SAM protein [Betaproteobacteria bacterium]|nr:radical SAM protein [Betaproteobacteria bacterium]